MDGVPVTVTCRVLKRRVHSAQRSRLAGRLQLIVATPGDQLRTRLRQQRLDQRPQFVRHNYGREFLFPTNRATSI